MKGFCIEIVLVYKELKSIKETNNGFNFGLLVNNDIFPKFY